MLGMDPSDEVAIRQGRMDDAGLRPPGSGAAEARAGEPAARRERARRAKVVRIHIIAVESYEPAEVKIFTPEHPVKAAREDMSFDDFAALGDRGLDGVAAELLRVIGR